MLADRKRCNLLLKAIEAKVCCDINPSRMDPGFWPTVSSAHDLDCCSAAVPAALQPQPQLLASN
jgi:hypothetical protein